MGERDAFGDRAWLFLYTHSKRNVIQCNICGFSDLTKVKSTICSAWEVLRATELILHRHMLSFLLSYWFLFINFNFIWLNFSSQCVSFLQIFKHTLLYHVILAILIKSWFALIGQFVTPNPFKLTNIIESKWQLLGRFIMFITSQCNLNYFNVVSRNMCIISLIRAYYFTFSAMWHGHYV